MSGLILPGDPRFRDPQVPQPAADDQTPQVAGFYLAGACPVCESPAFVHTPVSHQNDVRVYRTCNHRARFKLEVPKTYDPVRERQSLDLLFALIMAVIEGVDPDNRRDPSDFDYQEEEVGADQILAGGSGGSGADLS